MSPKRLHCMRVDTWLLKSLDAEETAKIVGGRANHVRSGVHLVNGNSTQSLLVAGIIPRFVGGNHQLGFDNPVGTVWEVAAID